MAQLMGCQAKEENAVSGVAVDSRELKAGNLFFALKGGKVDGHHYLQEVASKGAVGAVVSRSYQGDSFGLPLLYVDDGLKALQIPCTNRP